MGTRGPQPSQQTIQVCEALREGKSYRAIAKVFSISFQRVAEIAKQHGLRRKPLDSIVPEKSAQ